MRLVKNISLILFALILFNSTVTANNKIKVVNFEQFEPLLSKDSDTIFVINFWATWCAPCVREIPVFEQLNQKFSGEKVRIILVSLDFPNHLDSRLIPFVDRLEIENEVLLLDAPGANRWIPIVSESWSGAIPATLIYNRDYRQFFEKEFHFDELYEIISSLLN